MTRRSAAVIALSVLACATPGDEADGSRAYLDANRLRADVVETDSGLQYRVLLAGRGCHPRPGSTVTLHYYTRRAGHEAVIDSSYRRGSPSVFPLPGMIAGWQEGIPLMRVGAKWELVVPPSLAYGERPQPPIQPNEALVFVVELLATDTCAPAPPR